MMRIAWLIPLLLCCCAKPEFSKESRLLLGTKVTITAYGKNPKRAIDAAFSEIERIEALFSSFREDSLISYLNREGFLKRIEQTEEVIQLIERALFYAKETGGAFDPTVGPLIRLWGFKRKEQKVPEDAEIEDVLASVGYKNVVVDKDGVKLKEGCEIDLGGIAKGYCVDRAIEVLKKHNIKKALVNAGGDLYCYGKDFRIGIQHPRKDGLLGSFLLREKACATSGDYRRFFVYKGKRYSHIVDPRTGYPAQGVLSATVLAESATAADALATALFVMGKDGIKIIEGLGAFGLIIEEDMDIEATPEFYERIEWQ